MHSRWSQRHFPSCPTPPSSRAASSLLGGIRASELALEFGTPLVVYDELTLLAQARAYRAAAPEALVVYGTKAFPSLAVLRLFAEEGLGADVSTARRARVRAARRDPGRAPRRARQQQGGRVASRRDCGRRADRARLARGARARACVRRDAVPDPRHARDRGRHARSGEDGAPRLEVRPAARRRARGARRLRRRRRPARARRLAAAALRRLADDRRLDRRASPPARAPSSAGRRGSSTSAAASACATSLDEPAFTIAEFVGGLVDELERAWQLQDLPPAQLILDRAARCLARRRLTSSPPARPSRSPITSRSTAITCRPRKCRALTSPSPSPAPTTSPSSPPARKRSILRPARRHRAAICRTNDPRPRERSAFTRCRPHPTSTTVSAKLTSAVMSNGGTIPPLPEQLFERAHCLAPEPTLPGPEMASSPGILPICRSMSRISSRRTKSWSP